MNRTIILSMCLALLLAACAPSSDAVQTAIAQTQAAIPTLTPLPTPTIDSVITISPEEISAAWDNIDSLITSLITSLQSVRSVHWVRASADGVIDINVQTAWTAQESQSQTHFEIMQTLSGFCTNSMQQQIVTMTGVEDPIIKIRSESADDRYVYESETDFLSCFKIGTKDMNYLSWLEINKGKFSDGNSTMYE